MLNQDTATLETALRVLRKYPLCDHCLGRLFAKLGYGMTNEERGKAIKDYLHMSAHRHVLSGESVQENIEYLKALAISGHEPSIKLLNAMGIKVNPSACYICGGLFNNMDNWAQAIVNTLRNTDIEFNTFRLGTKVPSDLLKRELDITTEFSITTAESIKRELNREIGKKVSEILGKGFSREKPDIEVLIDITNGNVEIKPLPIYIMLRYRKILRTGLDNKVPINNLKELYNANAVIMHWIMSDKSRVRVFGDGKPLIIQIVSPKKRPRIDDVIGRLTNPYIQITNVTLIGKSGLIKVKTNTKNSTVMYRVLAMAKDSVTPEALLSLVNYFKNRQVTQVIRIRGKERRRISMVYEINAVSVTQNIIELLIKCQGNLNIYGFIHGYWGNIEPSIAGVLGTEVRPIEIDLIAIQPAF